MSCGSPQARARTRMAPPRRRIPQLWRSVGRAGWPVPRSSPRRSVAPSPGRAGKPDTEPVLDKSASFSDILAKLAPQVIWIVADAKKEFVMDTGAALAFLRDQIPVRQQVLLPPVFKRAY